MKELLAQQKSGIEKLHRLKVGALFMAPGTGKTRTAYELVKSVNTDHIIWMTPFQTKTNLLNEINSCGGLDNLQIVGIETISNSDKTYLELYRKVRSGNTFLIVDESLKIKNWEAKRTKRILELGKHCMYKLVLNGTPLSKNLLDVWPQFELLSPKILNMGINEFKSKFCETVKVTKKINGVKKISREFIAGYHNLDYLYSLIKHYVYECNLELSISKNFQDISYYLGDDEILQYQYIKEKYLDYENMQFMNNNIFLEMTQKMQHSYCCTENKFVELENLLERLDVSKVIVYTKYVVSRLAVQKRFPNLKVLSYGKHSFGLNLQNYNTTIYFDKTFDFSLMTQSEYRTYRTGQTDDCVYYSMTGNVGLERMINDNIFKKQSLLEYFKMVGIEQIKSEL